MKSEIPLKVPATALEHILSSAVVLNWDALASQVAPFTIRLEYHVGQAGAVDYLKLWARRREYWSLICDYAPNAGWSDGPRFANGYHSRPLGRLFQSILMNQNLFLHDYRPNMSALLEIGTPTSEEASLAQERMDEAFPRPIKAPAVSSVARLAAEQVLSGSAQHAKTPHHADASE